MTTKKKTQLQMVKDHLNRNTTITSWDAIQAYGITRLAALIHILRHDEGWTIKSVEEGKHVKYELKSKPNESR